MVGSGQLRFDSRFKSYAKFFKDWAVRGLE